MDNAPVKIMRGLLPIIPIAALTIAVSSCEGGRFPTDQPVEFVSCVDCTPQLRTIAILGQSGPGASPVGFVNQDENDRFLVVDVISTFVVQIYDENGVYVGDIGRRGKGPGEFLWIGAAAIAGDDLFLFDDQLARATIMDLDNGTVKIQQVGPRVARATVLPDGRFVANTPYGPGSGDPTSLQLHGDTGLIHSFRKVRGGAFSSSRISLATSPEGTIWVAPPNEYVLEHWSATGELLDTIHRGATWFPPHEVRPFRRGVQPQPLLRDIHIDEDGILWTLILVPDTRWADQFRDDPRTDMTFNGNEEHYFDTVVEALDLARREVIAYGRYDESAAGFTNRGDLVTYGEDPAGEFLLVIRRMEIAN